MSVCFWYHSCYFCSTGKWSCLCSSVLHTVDLIFYFIFDASKLCVLIQFTYLTCTTATVTLIDILLVGINAFKTTHGRCTLFIDASNDGKASNILFIALLIAFDVFELGLMIAGLVLYFLTTRQCCSRVIRDVKTSIVLNCTIGINTTIAIILFFFQVTADVINICATGSSAIEQVMLFLLFFTSTKVLNCLNTSDCTCARKENTMITQ